MVSWRKLCNFRKVAYLDCRDDRANFRALLAKVWRTGPCSADGMMNVSWTDLKPQCAFCQPPCWPRRQHVRPRCPGQLSRGQMREWYNNSMIPFNLGNSLKILVFLRPPTKSVSLSQKGRREGERGGESETERQIKAPTSAHLYALLAATSR